MPWCSQLWAIWGKEVSCAQAQAQAVPAPEAPRGAGLPVALLLSGQACLRPSCYGGCLSPPGPRQLKAPVQGGSTAYSAKHIQNLPPGLGASTFWDQGLAPPLALHLPTAPTVPRHPTSRTEPASCPLPAHCAQDPPPLRQAPPRSGRQMPPDQQSAQPPAETLLCCPAALPWKTRG